MRAILRLFVVSLATTLALASATPAFAEYPDDWPRANKAAAGLNDMLTAPADPVMFAIEGDEVFEEFWQPQVTGRMMGALVGLLQMPWRLVSGSFDLITSPLAPWMPMVSPAPRFHLIPHYHDNE